MRRRMYFDIAAVQSADPDQRRLLPKPPHGRPRLA